MRAYSNDLRERLVQLSNAATIRSATSRSCSPSACRFSSGSSKRKRGTGSFQPAPHAVGLRLSSMPRPTRGCRALVRAQPDATLAELRARLGSRVAS